MADRVFVWSSQRPRCPLSAVRSLSAFAPSSFSLLSGAACAPTGVNVWFLCPTGIEVAAGARRGRLGAIGGGGSQFESVGGRWSCRGSRTQQSAMGNRCEGLSA